MSVISRGTATRLGAAFFTIIAGCSLTACGTSSEPAASDSGQTGPAVCDADVTIATLPVGSAAALVLGVNEGFFEDQGLRVTLKDTAAASLQPSVVSGQAQFGFTSIPGILVTSSNGLPVQVVAPAAGYPADGQPNNIVAVAKANSGISQPSDLEGKVVGVDALYQLPHLGLIRAAENAGLDPSAIEVTEVAYPAMIEAMERGQIDAAVISDSFLLQAVSAGFLEVLPLNTGIAEGENQSIWFSSTAYADANPDVVECFQNALATSNEHASQNSDAIRKVLPTYTKITPEVAANLRLPNYQVELNETPFESYLKTMKGIGVIENDVDLTALIQQ